MTAPLVAKAPHDVDAIAGELARCAALAQSMPPAWDGAKVAHGFTAPGGANLGRVLPGRGIALASDLRSLGITKPIPYVFEKSLAMRAVDACGGRERLAMGAAAALLSLKLGALGMADALGGLALAITNYDGIINARANGNGQDYLFFAQSQTSVANQWHSIIRSSPKMPDGVFAPAAAPGTAPHRGTVGSLAVGLNNPGGTDVKYLLTVGFTSGATINIVLLVDILVAVSGINANINTLQTINSVALTRYTGTNSAGNLITHEVTTALGATGSNLTVTYTNQAGTTGRSTSAHQLTASAIVGRLQPNVMGAFSPLAAGDFGVRQIESATCSVAMGAGVLNSYIYRPIHMLPGVGQNVYVERDSTVQIDGLTELPMGTDNQIGCLSLLLLPSGTTTGAFNAFLRTVAG